MKRKKRKKKQPPKKHFVSNYNIKKNLKERKKKRKKEPASDGIRTIILSIHWLSKANANSPELYMPTKVLFCTRSQSPPSVN